jgi:dephospho-CoA kinase
MLRIGLTGGIASGKSAAAAVFAGLGVPVIDSDVIAREVVAPGSPGLAAIRARFGDGVLQADGQLDRRALRAQVFADPAARRDLEALTHPLIRQKMAALSAAAGGPYQVHAIPLLVEGGAKRPGIDRVLVIDCPEALQIERVMARDRVDEASARAVLAAQATRAQRLAAADDVIVNDRGLDALQDAVTALHRRYLELAAVYAGRDPAAE